MVNRDFFLGTSIWVVTGAIIIADLMGLFDGAAAALYVITILLAAQNAGRRWILIAGVSCALLAIAAFVISSRGLASPDSLAHLGVNLILIAASTLLCRRERSIRTTLAEQARILELTHDTVIIRDVSDVIIYWNDGAEQLYGYTRDEAIGRACQALLHCDFPSVAVARALQEHGKWSGELTRTCRNGRRIILASRWLQRRTPEGEAIGIIETSADLTEQRRSDSERQILERRYSAIFHAAGFATWESDWSGMWRMLGPVKERGADLQAWLFAQPEAMKAAISRAAIRDVNHAAVNLFGADSREALVGGNIVGRYLPESEQSIARMLVQLAGGAEVAEVEARFQSLAGGIVDVLLWATPLREGEPWSRVLVMVHDITERNKARAQLEQTSAELAHAARASMLGQLAASIAHEVNQPLSAILTYGGSGKRWLARDVPNITEAADCLDHVIANGNRAAEVLARVRALARKDPPQLRALDLASMIEETISLVQREAGTARIVVRSTLEGGLPKVFGDRVQVQQVIVNLLLNAIQATRNVVGRNREVRISAGRAGDLVRVAVQDTGSGIDGDPGQIFAPFFTTKADGMGMGLSISRSIVEAHGGQIEAANNPDSGATVTFTLPAVAAEG